MLEVRDVTVAFGGLLALNGVSFAVRPGEILGIVGPNGSGKTTALNVITGYVAPTRGQVLVEGRNVVGLGPDRIARQGVRRTYQNLRLFDEWTIAQNVTMGAYPGQPWRASLGQFFSRNGHAPAANLQEVLNRVGLQAMAGHPARGLPYGHKRRLEIARALIAWPQYILLDEPVAGMSQQERIEVEAIVRSLRELGLGVILIEHDVDFVFRLVDRVVVLASGEIIATGNPPDVRGNPAVIEAYLGVDA